MAPHQSAIIDAVSRYADTNPIELVAERFAQKIARAAGSKEGVHQDLRGIHQAHHNAMAADPVYAANSATVDDLYKRMAGPRIRRSTMGPLVDKLRELMDIDPTIFSLVAAPTVGIPMLAAATQEDGQPIY